ncbi:MAG TPA: hypothetical protein DCZ91_02750 [Lachnospiraceae bacterium]|nr:hypothetical protein [Lachnospiraceae bacterium]
MNDNQQITYMQARLIRLASREWNIPVKKVVSMFAEFDVLKFIRECFGIFHIEGDYAVLDDIMSYLHNRGVEIDAGIR